MLLVSSMGWAYDIGLGNLAAGEHLNAQAAAAHESLASDDTTPSVGDDKALDHCHAAVHAPAVPASALTLPTAAARAMTADYRFSFRTRSIPPHERPPQA